MTMDTFNIKKAKKDVNTTYLHVLIYLCKLLFFLALFIFAVAQKNEWHTEVRVRVSSTAR